ncbi:flavodoxin domain-containing protein [Cellulomonas sp. NPDC055163]
MKILVTAASRHGATREIGAVVARTLAEVGHEVDERSPADVRSLQGYDAVVLGSAVYTAHWIPEARDLAVRLRDELRERPVWLFSSGLATQPAASANSPHEVARLRADVGALAHRSFAGRLDRSELSFTERTVIAGARAREGDHRDLDAVRRWGQQIAAELASRPVPVA